MAVVYLVGFITAAGVARSRAGIGQRGRLAVGLIIGSPRWFFTQMASMVAWPAFLCVWLVRGRPKSPWKSIAMSNGSVRVQRRTIPEDR